MSNDEEDIEQGLEAGRKHTKKMGMREGMGDFAKYSFARYYESR